MTLALEAILRSAGLNPSEVLTVRHTFVKEHAGTGMRGIHADSTDEEILTYTADQSAVAGEFPAPPARHWVVFLKETGARARLWAVVEHRGVLSSDGLRQIFDLAVTDHLADLRNRLVVSWPAPRAWKVAGTTAARYEVLEIADAQPIPFPGFDRLVLDYVQLQAVMREHRYAAWQTALASVKGIYLITDTRDGRHYVGKADGAERILQRWYTYAANGHGGNVELRGLDPSTFRYSLLRVFDPATPEHEINTAESHFKNALDSRRHGLNRG